MKINMFTVADSVIVDQATNSMSFINILESVSSAQFPILIPRIMIVSTYKKEPGDADLIQLDLSISINKKIIISNPIQVNFQESQSTRNIVRLQGLPIPETGSLDFVIRKDSKRLKTWSVDVSQIESGEVVERINVKV